MTLLGYRISYKLSYRQQINVQILTLLSLKVSIWVFFSHEAPPKMQGRHTSAYASGIVHAKGPDPFRHCVAPTYPPTPYAPV